MGKFFVLFLALAASAVFATCDGRIAGSRHTRSLLQNLPVNSESKELAANATAAGRTALEAFGTSNATLTALIDTYMLAHSAADGVFTSSAAGQASTAIAGAAAAGASQLASAATLANDAAARTEATAALSAANALIAGIADANPLTVSKEALASFTLLANIAHDGTLIQYWQNLTNGKAQDADTFNETVAFVAGLPEEAEKGAAAGATAMAVIAAEVTGHNILGAIYVYNGEYTQAFQESIANSRAIIKAANGAQTNAACSPDRASALAEQAEQAAAAAVKAGVSLSAADIDAARQAATAVVTAATGNNGCTGFASAPALAPSSAPVTASSTG